MENNDELLDRLIKELQSAVESKSMKDIDALNRKVCELMQQVKTQAEAMPESAKPDKPAKTKRKRGVGRVYIRGNSWWIDFSEDGKRIRKVVAPVYADKEMNKKMRKIAEASLAASIKAVAENRFLDVKRECKVTFTELADKYLVWAKENHVAYENSDVYFVAPLKEYFADTLISDISREDVGSYKKWRKRDTEDENDLNSAINHELTTLRRMFNLAMEEWENPENKQLFLFEGRNPAENFKKLDEESRDRYLTKGELVRVVNHILGKIETIKNGRDKKGYRRLLDFILIAVTTGLRKGDIRSLKFGSKDIHLSDTDPMENFISLPGTRTKKGKARIVYLNKISKGILARPFDLSYEPRHLWETVRQDTGLTDVSIHDLRRTFATYINGLGVGAFTLAALMGHKVPGLDITAIYAKPDRERMREAIDKLETDLAELIPVINGTIASHEEKREELENSVTHSK